MEHSYFFCGIGGSGMMPLALILSAQGAKVKGSDRAYDQALDKGDHPHSKFQNLKNQGITIAPQDGSGLKDGDILVVSAAIEDTIPDVARAKALGLTIKTRAQILAQMFNAYDNGISIAGTSGKSTVTGMCATIFDALGRDPTVMNGAMISNFADNQAAPAPNMRIGKSDIFITETDESDGSIALYNPAIASVNNIALDHMPLEDLKTIFAGFIGRARKAIVINADDEHLTAIAKQYQGTAPIIRYGINCAQADLNASNLQPRQDGISFTVNGHSVNLKVPGRHNVLNALAALSIAKAYGLELNQSIKALEHFTGVQRRLQLIGTNAQGITVIDDFAHNPDKIAASLQTFKSFAGRLIVMFQPHGFAPLRLMGAEMINSFAQYLSPQDQLIMPEVYYAGGTVDRSTTAKDIIALAQDKNLQAYWFETRDQCGAYIKSIAQQGDRVIIMGARDDSLTSFAKSLL